MNTTKSSINFAPPKEMFSRQWFHSVDDISPTLLTNDLYPRIDTLREKLKGLELGFQRHPHAHDFHIPMARISWVNSAIGIWNTVERRTIQTVHPKVEKVYPKISSNPYVKTTYAWDDAVLGKEKKWGCVLIMLSNEAVKWLNGISQYLELDKNEKELV